MLEWVWGGGCPLNKADAHVPPPTPILSPTDERQPDRELVRLGRVEKCQDPGDGVSGEEPAAEGPPVPAEDHAGAAQRAADRRHLHPLLSRGRADAPAISTPPPPSLPKYQTSRSKTYGPRRRYTTRTQTNMHPIDAHMHLHTRNRRTHTHTNAPSPFAYTQINMYTL